MSGRRTAATALRVVQQLRHDPRTVVLLLAIPVVLLALVKWVFNGSPAVFQRVGVPLLGVFPLTSMFLVTSITMLRERTGGTLERLLAGPIAKIDLLAGYALAFALVAVAQGAAAAFVAFELLGLEAQGPAWAVVAVAILNAVLGCSLGLLVSAFATTEFQAVQFMPAFLLPQLLLCGLLQPRDEMARPLELVSYALPMTYAFDALHRIAANGQASMRLGLDLVVLASVTVLALLLGAATLRRRTP